MFYCGNINTKLKACNQTERTAQRYLNPNDITVSRGYAIEVFAQGLNSPSSILFSETGEMFIADSGYITGNPAVYRLVNGNFEVIADQFMYH